MARIRTIKPDFFRNLKLYRAEVETKLPLRLAFAGLWTACDRSGRFKWVPETLKLDCLPYDQCDFSRVLDALWTRGYIEKYASTEDENNEFYGFVPTWDEHQHINNREQESNLPNPHECYIVTREGRVVDASEKLPRGREGERKGKEREREIRVKFTPPTLDEMIEYFVQNGYSAKAAKKAFDHYNIADWHDTQGNKVRNWKQKCSTVWFKDENMDQKSISQQIDALHA